MEEFELKETEECRTLSALSRPLMSDRDKEAWIAQRLTRKVDALERVLVLHLDNRATYAQWRDEMVRVTLPKTNKKTGEMKSGISEKTFDRRLKVVIERGHTVRPDDLQGGFYSIIAGPWADGIKNNDGGFDRQPPSPPPSTAVKGDDLVAEALRHARLKRWPR
jgi:hypothetical protein